ncbi:MAG TPA: wax ester/triacylglycerol synthase family O-acyltransferase, partial [Halieaceae bacterium]|nr:wax ester/triacylglycerol synthase family O-acyltransferase [Halieaceae bacterium]
LHARPLDRARPLWEAYIIEGLDNVAGLPPGCYAMLLKVHHAAIDGASGVEL